MNFVRSCKQLIVCSCIHIYLLWFVMQTVRRVFFEYVLWLFEYTHSWVCLIYMCILSCYVDIWSCVLWIYVSTYHAKVVMCCLYMCLTCYVNSWSCVLSGYAFWIVMYSWSRALGKHDQLFTRKLEAYQENSSQYSGLHWHGLLDIIMF